MKRHHAAHHPAKVHPKPRTKSAAVQAVSQERRQTTVEGVYGIIGTGATISGATVETSASPSLYYPGIVYDSTGLKAYNSGGVVTMTINAADGSVTVNGTGIITGGTIQTSASNPRVIMDGSGIRAYNSGGTNTFNLAASDGSLTVTGGTITGGTIQTAASGSRVVMDSGGLRAYAGATQTVNIGSDGSFSLNTSNASITSSTTGVTISSAASTASGARIIINPTGIIGYNASNQQQFLLDATSGLITCTGVITANPGSTVPWQTTGFFVGGGNLLNNASAEDPTSTTQTLYMPLGAGVTAGTFTLQYGSGTITSALNWNATAAQVATALNAAGVLPAGTSVTCSGGPLPGTPISILMVGFTTIAPSVITIASQSLTGGTVVLGAFPIGWTVAPGNVDYISYSSAFHGGGVFRITALASQSPSISQTNGPYGLVAGTPYTLSAYFQAPLAARFPQLSITWQDVFGNTVSTTTTTSAATTTTLWKRLVATQTVPVAATRQQISIGGAPTGGSFTLTYNGQTTAAIAWNASAATVLAALKTLSNVGTSGAAFATGGPLPGTPVVVSFVCPPAATPTTMTHTDSLTGGTSPSVSILNLPAVNIQSTIGISSAQAGEVFYVDAAQIEVGDAPTGYKPRSDEILANKVIANMINVAQLSAISANMGSITAGTITGATIQTAAGSVAKTKMDSTGLRVADSSGTDIVRLDATYGLEILTPSAGVAGLQSIDWVDSIPNSNKYATIGANHDSGGTYMQLWAYNTASAPGTRTTGSGISISHGVPSMDGSIYAQAVTGSATVYGMFSLNVLGEFQVGKSSGSTYAYIGTWNNSSSYAYFSSTNSPGNGYAVLQSSSGESFFNTSSGHAGHLRVDNADQLTWDAASIILYRSLYPVNASNGLSQTSFWEQYQNSFGSSIYTNAANGWTVASDRMLKRDIQPLRNPLAALRRLEGKSFAFRNEGHRGLGFIAQEVAEVFPEAAGEGPKGVHLLQYDSLIAPLWEACRAMLGKIEQMGLRIEQLEQDLFMEAVQ